MSHTATCGCGRAAHIETIGDTPDAKDIGWTLVDGVWKCQSCSGNEDKLRAAFGATETK